MIYEALFVSLCVAYVSSEVVNSVPCANETTFAEDVRMEVTGCTVDHEACQLIKGLRHEVIFHFTPTRDFVGYTQFKVFGVFKDFSVPYGRTTDACQNATVADSTDTCRSTSGFLQGKQYVHHSSFGVSRTYPSVKLKVRFMYLDRKSKVKMLCQEVPVELIDPPNEA